MDKPSHQADGLRKNLMLKLEEEKLQKNFEQFGTKSYTHRAYNRDDYNSMGKNLINNLEKE